MNCHELDSQLTPYLDEELVAEARLAFEGHLATCERCARHVETERHNLHVIRSLARQGSPRAPDALRSSLFASVRRDDQRLRVGRLARLGVAATAAALAAFIANHEYRAWQFGLYEQDAALRHSRHFPLEIQQPRTEAIEAWFGGKLDHRVNVPRFPNATAAGARILQVRDKPAAYIRYDSERPMGLFVYDDDHEVAVGSEPAVGSSHGYNVVSWREGDVVYQLVTDLDEHDLRDLVPNHGEAAGETPLPSTRAVEVAPASVRQ